MAAQNKTKLGVESLELRENPAVAVLTMADGVHITADNKANVVTITRTNIADELKITDNTNGKTWHIDVPIGAFPKVFFHGGAGNDQVYATGAWVPVSLSGGGGNDILVGGVFNDRIDGGAGNDILRGGWGNDTIYGRSGIDKLYGEDGSDFLDAGGSVGELENGGAGADFLARTPVVNKTTADDVHQTGTPTCWIDAPLAAAAKAGINLASRITYLGEGNYRVKLLEVNGGACYQTVNLEGGMKDFEPTPNGDESWVILFQRAICQQKGIDWTTLSGYPSSGGWSTDVLTYLTGRQTYGVGNQIVGGQYNTTGDAEMVSIKNDLAAGRLVCAHTRQGDYGSFNVLGSVCTPKLCGAHVYAVVSVDLANDRITLRNPWGTDAGGGQHVTMTDADPDDGLVTISFQEFYGSIWSYARS